MKRFSSLLLTAAVAIATSVSAVAQTADEVAKAHVKAIGGADAWRKVNTMKMTGNMNMQGMEIPVVITCTHNVGSRVNISAMGMEGYIITTPTAGWMYMPFMGQPKPEPMPEEQVKGAAEELDLHGDFIDYEKKGNKVTMEGKEKIGDAECFKLRMQQKGGQEKVYYIDSKNYYIVRATSKTMVDGKEEESTENYSNYQTLPEGIVMPMTTESPMGPITFTSIEVNKPVEAATYEPTKG